MGLLISCSSWLDVEFVVRLLIPAFLVVKDVVVDYVLFFLLNIDVVILSDAI